MRAHGHGTRINEAFDPFTGRLTGYKIKRLAHSAADGHCTKVRRQAGRHAGRQAGRQLSVGGVMLHGTTGVATYAKNAVTGDVPMGVRDRHGGLVVKASAS